MAADRSRTRPNRTSDLAAIGLLAIAAACWAGNHVTGRWIAIEHPPVPPAGLSGVRWMLAFVVVLPFSWRQVARDWPQLRESAGTLLALGVFGGSVFSFVQYYALQFTTAVNVGVMNSVGPAFIILAGVLIFRDAVGWRQIGGIATSLVGVLVIITRGEPALLASLRFNLGDLLALLNMAVFAIYSACLRLTPRLHVLTFVTALCLIASLGSVPVAVIEMLAGYSLHWTGVTIWAVLYTGLFTSLLAYFCWSAGVAVLGLQRAGPFLHLTPMFSALFAVLLLGEQPRLYHAVGLLLIIGGVTIAARRA